MIFLITSCISAKFWLFVQLKKENELRTANLTDPGNFLISIWNYYFTRDIVDTDSLGRKKIGTILMPYFTRTWDFRKHVVTHHTTVLVIAHFHMPLLLSGILCFVKLDTFSQPLHLKLP